jgi:glutathione S-transferase
MNKLIFYTNPQSRGRIVRWMLEEVGTDYETQIIEYGPAMKSEPYISINPMGKVPAIVHDGRVVTECPAILAYLADAFPEAGLAPPLAERHAYYRWLFFAAGPLEAAAVNKAMGFEVPDDPQKQGMIGYGNYDRVVSTLTKLLADTVYVAGDRFTAADLYLAAHLGWGMQFGTVPEKPEFQRYFERISGREAYRRAFETDDALVKQKAAESAS